MNKTNSQKAVTALTDLSGLTQKQISESAGVTCQQFTEWKGGRRKPSLENFLLLCRAAKLEASAVLKHLNL
jgi:transcriptional regulator with XRE-family HTH domain